MTNEPVKFSLIQMPCCGHSLCWLNPRLPNYCPECGKFVLRELQQGDHAAIRCDAWLKLDT